MTLTQTRSVTGSDSGLSANTAPRDRALPGIDHVTKMKSYTETINDAIAAGYKLPATDAALLNDRDGCDPDTAKAIAKKAQLWLRAQPPAAGEAAHTPLMSWPDFGEEGKNGSILIGPDTDTPVVIVQGCFGKKKAKETASRIVRACNAHAGLVTACKKDVLKIEQLCDMVNTYAAKLGLGRKVNVTDWTDTALAALASAKEAI